AEATPGTRSRISLRSCGLRLSTLHGVVFEILCFETPRPFYGNTSSPLWMNHITLVSVTTEAKVPISTATDAGSIQVLFCRAITNTFSAGDRRPDGGANGPKNSIRPNTIKG